MPEQMHADAPHRDAPPSAPAVEPRPEDAPHAQPAAQRPPFDPHDPHPPAPPQPRPAKETDAGFGSFG